MDKRVIFEYACNTCQTIHEVKVEITSECEDDLIEQLGMEEVNKYLMDAAANNFKELSCARSRMAIDGEGIRIHSTVYNLALEKKGNSLSIG